MNIVLLAHTPTSSNFVVGSHHYLRELIQLGHNVLHIPSPTHILSKKPQTQRKNTNEIELNSILPIGRISWLDAIIYIKLKMVLKKQIKIRTLTKIDFIIVDQPTFSELAIWLARKYDAKIIYRPTDIYSEMSGDWVKKHEIKILNHSNKIIATSKVVISEIRKIKDLSNHQTEIIENGFDIDHFKPVKTKREFPPKRLIYVGSLDSRFDYESLAYLGYSIPSLTIDIYGPKPDTPSLTKIPSNVIFHGPIEYEKLPSIYSKYDAALILMVDSKANHGRSPMKIYEYLASGLPVIARSTTELQSRNIENLYLYKSGDELVGLINEIKLFIDNVVELKKHSWKSKAKLLVNFLGV